jgi:hypothetical protein
MFKANTTTQKQKEIKWTDKAKQSLSTLFQRKAAVKIAPNLIAGGVVFWYMEQGIRYFVMVKPVSGGNARFASCLGIGEQPDIASAVSHSVKQLLGKVFYRSLDKALLTADRVATVNCFNHETDDGKSSPVHGVFWCVQITPEQAQLCQPKEANTDVIAVPEMGIMTDGISPSHQTIYQTMSRHLYSSNSWDDLGLEQVEDMAGHAHTISRTIH